MATEEEKRLFDEVLRMRKEILRLRTALALITSVPGEFDVLPRVVAKMYEIARKAQEGVK